MASATSQRHRSAGTLGRGQVLAFGSRTAAAKSPQKASRGVGRRGTLGANDVDDSGLAALQAEGEGAEALAGRSGSGTRGQRRGAGGQSAHGGNGQALAAGRLPRMLEPVTPQRPQQATSSRRLSVGPEDAPLRDAVSKLHQRKPQLRPIDMKAVKDVGMDRVQVLSDRPPLPDHSTTPPTGFLTERANRDSRGNGSFGAATPHAWGSASAASSGQQRWSGSHGSWAISPTADEAAAAMWEGVPRPQPGNEEPALPTVRPSPATVAHGAHYQFSAGPRAGPFAQLQVHATDLSLDSGIGESPMDKTSGRAGPAQESVACEVDESANLAASNAGPMYHLWGSQALGGAAPDASAQAEPSPDRDARRLAPGPLPPLAPGDPRDTPARAAAASPGVEHPGSKQSRSRRRIATDVNRAAELSRMQGWDKSLEDAGRAALTAAGGLGIVGVGVDPLSGAGAGLPGGSGAGPRVSGPRHSGPRSPGAAMYGRGHRRSQSGSFSLHSDGARRPRRATTPVGLDPDSPDQSGRYLPQAWQTGAPGGDGGGGGGGDGHAAAPPNPFPAIRESSLSPVPSPSYVSRQQRYQRVQESVAAANLAAGLPTVLESGSRASQGTASEGPSKVVSATSAGAWPPPAGSGSAHANASSSGDVVVVDASGSRTSGGVQRSPLGLDASAQLSGSTDAPAPPAAADVSPELPRASRGVEAAQAAPRRPPQRRRPLPLRRPAWATGPRRRRRRPRRSRSRRWCSRRGRSWSCSAVGARRTARTCRAAWRSTCWGS
ncbi:unnamed protein product [Pedinophyceae sp. YPF-701]|nr:unnamed protein product [Pedinophyceae sp. YPF-701]